MKLCKTCNLTKNKDEFKLRPYKNGKVGLDYQCMSCSTERKRLSSIKRRSDPNNRKLERERAKEAIKTNPIIELLKRAKERARKYNLPFNLVKEDIYLPTLCPLLGIKLLVNNKRQADNSYSLDRIEPMKGYVKGNVRVISSKANMMKGNATREELLLFCNNMIKLLNDKD